jgi:DNA-binding YbaB/EbfC family protein
MHDKLAKGLLIIFQEDTIVKTLLKRVLVTMLVLSLLLRSSVQLIGTMAHAANDEYPDMKIAVLSDLHFKAGDGAVTLKINGKKQIIGLDISPEIVDADDIETLTDILTAAFNEAINKVETTNSEAMAKVTGGLNVPGLM